jgi:hypothetical protein
MLLYSTNRVTLLNYVFNSRIPEFRTTAVVIMSRSPRSLERFPIGLNRKALQIPYLIAFFCRKPVPLSWKMLQGQFPPRNTRPCVGLKEAAHATR